ncbi:MAG: preprotein translocase subunit SecG [Chitinophagaceae bacterium]|jgi:preprotein translocase subunit SecG|nr:preprotein translocase subunit SecG [Chitinophagaceae bacterium]MCF8288997.1 preprotein translocase subunit SecG [Chitinophagaceae bacterium]MCF8421276.1 preprotein translocase subunit SecG [Chitinophagaceae bacterium]
MITFFLILIVVACLALGFMVLIQNPKGGGLNANVGGLSNNFMGVKQTTDVLEKGTWIFASVIAVLAITSTLFLSGNTSNGNSVLDKVNTSTTTSPATQMAPPPPPPAAVDSNKK